MNPKPASASKLVMSELVLPFHANPAGNMHGGEVMKLMDSAAGVVARRHALTNVVTASVDRLSFREPIFVGDLVFCEAELTYTGRTSMEVFVTVKVENLERGETKHALDGYFHMVALDRNGRPTEIPPLLIETEEQRARFESARKRLEDARRN